MTEKELRKLKRVELLELLVEQAAEMEALRGELQAARDALAERNILLRESGSIAEAALRLNRVFEAADQAAREYVESTKRMQDQAEALLAEAARKCGDAPAQSPDASRGAEQ